VAVGEGRDEREAVGCDRRRHLLHDRWMINFLPWSLDSFAHDTVLGRTFITGYGRFFDGAFFLDYNKGALVGWLTTPRRCGNSSRCLF